MPEVTDAVSARPMKFGSQAHEALFLAYIATLPFALPMTLFGRQVYLSDFALMIVFVAYGVKVLRHKQELQFGRSFHWALVAYAGALVLATVTSTDRYASAGKLLGSLGLISSALLASSLVRNVAAFRAVRTAWLLASAVPVLASILAVVLFYAGIHWTAVLTGHGSLPNLNFPRIAGFDTYPNMFCNYLTFTLALALGTVGGAKRKRAAIAMVLVATLFTWSPGLGGIALLLGVWWWIYGRRWRKSALVIAILAAFVFWFAASVRLFSPVSHGVDSPLIHGKVLPSQRALCWLSALNTFRQHPLTGVGLGVPVANVDYLQANRVEEHLTDAHNTWISLAAQTGIPGLLAMIVLIAVVFRSWSPTRARASEMIPLNSVMVAIVCGFLYQSVHGGFESARHLWPVLGMAQGLKFGRTPTA